MTKLLQELKGLLKKNWITWKRNKLWSSCEILAPVFLIISLALLQIPIPDKHFPHQTYSNLLQNSKSLTKDPFQNCFSETSQLSYTVISNLQNFSDFISANLSFFNLTQSPNTFSSEADLDSFIQSSEYESSQKLCFAVVFLQDSPSSYTLKLKFNSSSPFPLPFKKMGLPVQVFSPSAYSAIDESIVNPHSYSSDFYSWGFIYIQNLVGTYLLGSVYGKGSVSVELGDLYFNPYKTQDFLATASGMIVFFTLIIYLIPFCRILTMVVWEKETRLRQVMMIMGCSPLAYWMSWIIYSLLINTFVSLFLSLTTSHIGVFSYSNPGLIFLVFWVYSLSNIQLCIMLSVIFNRAKTAVMVGVSFLILNFFVSFSFDRSMLPAIYKIAASVFPSTALCLVTRTIISLEQRQIGLQFENLSYAFLNYSAWMYFSMVTFDIFVLLFLSWYFNKVLYNGISEKHPFYFLFTKKYWCPRIDKQLKIHAVASNNDKCEDNQPAFIRQIEEGEALLIRNLCKAYSKKEVIKNLNLEIFNGQITSLLGHNGAGKTTILSMITGLVLPSSGDIMIEHQPIHLIRGLDPNLIGLCPQQNLLFPNLTPKETLMLFCVFKGSLNSSEIAIEISNIITDLNMESFQDKPADFLSGGQKRTLSLAIALIAGPKIVLLDEPTAGMDSIARRHMWEVLKKYKQNKVIILTTHYMEEADVLSDRIVIINEGQLICCGSSLFLKSTYEVGYNLTCEKIRESDENNDAIHAFVSNYVQEFKILSDNKREVKYRLAAKDILKFNQMFNELDYSLNYLEIKSYYVVAGSLEEVFLRIIKEKINGGRVLKMRSLDYLNNDAYLHKGSAFPLKDKKLFFLQISAIFFKRFRCSIRDYKRTLCEVFVPVFLILMGLVQLIVPFPLQEHGEYLLTIRKYDFNHTVYVNQDVDLFNSYFNSTSFSYSKVFKNNLQEFADEVFDKQGESFSIGSFFVNNLDQARHEYSVTILTNQTAVQASPIFVAEFLNTLLKKNDSNFQLNVYNHPFCLTENERKLDNSDDFLLPTIIFSVAFSFVPTVVIQFVVKERENSIKVQQFNSGLPIFIYWVCNYIWDVLKFYIPALVVIILIISFNVSMYVKDLDSVKAVIGLIFLYGPSIISFTYCTSFLFEIHPIAQVTTLIFNVVIGGFVPAGVYLMLSIPSIRKIGLVFSWVLKVFPSFALGFGFFQLGISYAYNTLIDEPLPVSVLSLNSVGGSILFLSIDTLLYLLLVFFIEFLSINHKCKRKKLKKNLTVEENAVDLDEDVKKEIDLSLSANPFSSQINVRNLMKVYDYKGSQLNAVNSCSFTIEDQECFAVLGTNGAGKSTMFKILTGEIPPSSGDAYICGYQISKDLNHIRKRIGYCPQFDFTCEYLTVFENMSFFAKLKGVPPNFAEDEIIYLVKSVGLTDYIDVLSINLSGGNKRKLALAISLINNPQVLFLDEPSAGMDPLSREKMLRLLTKAKKGKSAVILTTHLVEEAEALCDRLAIMVDGVFKCIGTAVHIRNKFGNYIQIDFKLKPHESEELRRVNRHASLAAKEELIVQDIDKTKQISETKFMITEGLEREKDTNNIEDEAWEKLTKIKEGMIISILTEQFGLVEVIENYYLMIKLKLQRRRVKHIGRLFEIIETNKQNIGIETYSITQASLEQIFNHFVKGKEEVHRKF